MRQNDGAELLVASPIEESIVVFSGGSLFPHPRYNAPLHVAMQTRLYHHPPLDGAVRFGPLGPTPRGDSRCTLPVCLNVFRSFAEEHRVVLKKAQRSIAVMTEKSPNDACRVTVIDAETFVSMRSHDETFALA